MKRRLGAMLALSLCAAAPAMAECWAPRAGDGQVGFTARQAGAAFRGRFASFSGQVCIAEQSRIRVAVRTASVDTRLPELDEALRGPEFFDARRWPQASFESDAVKALGGGRYEVAGRLTIRDVTRSLVVPFTLRPEAGADRARLEARMTLLRLDYGVGIGQWADTRWLDDAVELSIALTMQRAAGPQ